jgi:hypothetical protein
VSRPKRIDRAIANLAAKILDAEQQLAALRLARKHLEDEREAESKPDDEADA